MKCGARRGGLVNLDNEIVLRGAGVERFQELPATTAVRSKGAIFQF